MRQMLTQKTRQELAFAFTVLGPILLCMVLWVPLPAASQQQEKLSKKELKTLIATAKAPEDHLRLAAYYRAQANDYLGRQKQHQADAEVYESNPRYPTKYPSASKHCRDWAYNDGQSAKQALALAEMHETMAREATK